MARFKQLGETLWEDNPTAGVLIIFVAIFGVGFIYWKQGGDKKLSKWRDRSERKRIKRRQYDEGW